MSYFRAGSWFLIMLAFLIHSSPAFASEQTAASGQSKELDEEDSVAGMTEVDGVYVLEDLVVSRKTDLSGVRYESDDTLTVTSSSLFTIFEALNSGLGAAVNFKVSFARNSTVMNADGQYELDKMAKALTYMAKGSSFELLVHKGSSQSASSHRKDLEESRVSEILSTLRRRYKLDHDFSVSYENVQNRSSAKELKDKTSQTLTMTIVNLGQS